MRNLISNYFSFQRLKAQFKNKSLSLLAFYDRDSRVSYKSRIQRFVVIRDSSVGEYSYIGHHSNLYRATIGKFCSIASHVHIGMSHHPTNFISTSPLFFSVINGTGFKWIDQNVYDDKPEPAIIGNDVWIGINVTIMGGVRIGNGAIIAAHAVVTKSVPPYAIVGGIPAKIIKYRFEADIIDKLEKTSWWDLPDAVLKKNIKKFQVDISTRPDSLTDII